MFLFYFFCSKTLAAKPMHGVAQLASVWALPSRIQSPTSACHVTPALHSIMTTATSYASSAQLEPLLAIWGVGQIVFHVPPTPFLLIRSACFFSLPLPLFFLFFVAIALCFVLCACFFVFCCILTAAAAAAAAVYVCVCVCVLYLY